MKSVLLAVLVMLALVCRPFGAAAQEQTVQGTVKDGKGEALPGATVVVKGTTAGASSGADGRFSVQAPSNAVLVFSSVGFTRQEVPVNGQSTINVVLAAADQDLNEVVVIGYGTAKKSDLTGSVASVSGAQLTQVATSDPVQALQGRVAGVEVTSNSGQPGSGTRIRIRGVGTINNADPLYVVDGIQTGDISFLLPTDIESTEILKDASATAIYGSRGANGVVLITTKHGKAGKTQFNLFGYTGYQEIRKKLDLTNAQQYATLVTEAYANGKQAIPGDYTAILNSALQGGATGTNFQDFVTQKGLITNYALSASGGTEQNRYLISGNYFQQDGIIAATGLKKYVIRVNDDVVLTDRVKAGVSATFTTANQTGAGDGTGNAFYSPVLQYATQANPIGSPYNADGSYSYDNITSFTPNLARYISEQQGNKTQSSTLFSNAYLDVTILKGLTFRSTFGVNYNNYHPKYYQPQYFLGANDQRSQSALIETRGENVGWVSSNYINYTKDLGSNSSFSATLGQEAQRGYGNSISISGYNVPADPTLQYISAARSSSSTVRSGQYDGGLISYFGRANYNFRDRYLLTATLRFDQTSRFLPAHRTGTFPSAGAAWNISNEDFMKGQTIFSVLKLRGSYGLVGNQNAAPNYGYASTAVNNQLYVFNKTVAPGLAVATLNNPDLKWETAITTDFGIDASFLDSKLTFTGDYFNRRTKDMIALLPVPDYIGQSPASANVASLYNRGVELALNYRNEIGKFGYNVGLNFTKINNRITDLGGASPIAGANVDSHLGSTTLTSVGHEIASFYGLQADGVFHSQDEANAYKIQPGAQAGDVKYIDVNGDGKIDSNDYTYLGSATPRFTYGASVNLSYSGFDFKVLLYGVQGAEAINAAGFNLNKSSNFAGLWTNFYASRLDRWTPANPNSNQPRVTSFDTNNSGDLTFKTAGGYNDRFSSRYVEDASYLRVRNIELGYSLSKAVLNTFRMNGLRVFASVDNAFTITKYTGLDPEISTTGYYGNALAYGVDNGNYPQPRTYRLGLNVQF
ncbi:SusC/RagA family TonB-linked outer membrane protein [Hymenobacter caeli]|uniref:TonB-linked SusC/RagA family outer membrane protein n=1 Tax=Hymenobacter caeli TaxID=2735894 RepID=A0ABX2FV10_9BACT|nr:TonB-dependent receptor [Hymenobacter caeli]NRT20267.1 TonB-linked SusC/RagA family outer membrane protein [Hymenobacter caeli]